MDRSKLAEKYIADHNNPVVKAEQFGSKLFTSDLSQEQEQLKDKCLESIKTVLSHDRVERRHVRATADWLHDQNVAKVTKITGALSNFGFQNKSGKFLNSEEALFLLETNKLELRKNNVPISIQEGYRIIKDFDKYLVYKKLALQGYKLKPVNGEQPKENKRKLESEEGPPRKVSKNEPKTEIEEIFEKMRQNGPQSFPLKNGSTQLSDYRVSPPSEKSEFGLIVETKRQFTSVDGNSENIYALCSDDNVSFYKFFNANLPVL